MNHCRYCNSMLFGEDDRKRGTCDDCQEMIDTNPKIVEWVMRVLQGQISKEVEDHTERYNHERSSSCGCC